MKETILFKQNKGITLVEMLIAVALISVVVSLGYMFYFTGFKAFDRNVNRVELQQNVRHSMSYISRELLNAEVNPSDGNSIGGIIRPRTDTQTDINELILWHLVWCEQSRRYLWRQKKFDLRGTTLQVNYNLGFSSPNPLAEGITEFRVARVGRMITLTISAGAPQQDNHFSLSTQVLLRR